MKGAAGSGSDVLAKHLQRLSSFRTALITSPMSRHTMRSKARPERFVPPNVLLAYGLRSSDCSSPLVDLSHLAAGETVIAKS